jgi:hypothetical protein
MNDLSDELAALIGNWEDREYSLLEIIKALKQMIVNLELEISHK